MFTRWLFTVFPSEMLAGSRLVRPDLMVWIVAAMAMVASPFAATALPAPGSGLALRAMAGLVGVFVVLMFPLRFRDAAQGTKRPWGESLRAAAPRALPLVWFLTLTVTICQLVASIARRAVAALIEGTPFAEFAPTAMSVIILLSLLTRFSYVPFLTVLNTRESLDTTGVPGIDTVPGVSYVAWPLLVSSAMTDGRRWRVAPYVLLNLFAPFPAIFLSPVVQLPVMVALILVTFVASAVIYIHYDLRAAAFAADTA